MRELISILALSLSLFQAQAHAAPTACLNLNEILPKVQDADNARYTITNIKLVDDSKPVSDQFRFVAVRERRLLDTDLVGTGWRKVKQHGCESVEIFDFLTKKFLEFKITSASPTKLVMSNENGVQFTYETLGKNRLKTTLRRPMATPHTCGDETHPVIIEGELDYGKTLSENITISASLLEMIQNSFPYFATPAAEYAYCAKLSEPLASKDAPTASPAPASEVTAPQITAKGNTPAVPATDKTAVQ